MNSFTTFLCIVLFVICFFLYVADEGEPTRLYCWLFQNKDWRNWKKIINAIPNAEFVEHLNFSEYSQFENYRYRVKLDNDQYDVVYWVKRGFVTVHKVDEDDSCFLSEFDKYHSLIAAEAVKELIEKTEKS